MKNLKPIQEIKKAALTWAGKGNELIKRANIPWEVQLPEGFGEAYFTYADNRIVLDLSQAELVTFVACDAGGNQFLITTFGTAEPYVAP